MADEPENVGGEGGGNDAPPVNSADAEQPAPVNASEPGPSATPAEPGPSASKDPADELNHPGPSAEVAA